jgi:Flp pilus assembly protein TadG
VASARGRGRERGAALAEFVVCFPVLLVLMLVVVDLGANVGDGAETGRAAQDVAAAAATGRIAGDTSCRLAADGDLPQRTIRVVCAAKRATGRPDADVRVRVRTSPDGAALAVCVMTRAASASGLLGAAFAGRAHEARAPARLVDGVTPPADGGEAPLPGHGWRFCAAPATGSA